jgi:GT2 family glycosyltransferase
MRYALTEIEITDPAAALRIAGDESGAGILVRYRDCPVAFVLLETPPGMIQGSALRDLLLSRAGEEITAELLARELTPLTASKTTPSVTSPSVTVAICTRDHPDYVRRVVKSLLATAHRTSAELDILIVDNAPSDEKTRVVAAGFPAVRYVCEPKPGLDFGRNLALRECRGEVLAFIDDDAVVDRWWLAGLHDAWAGNPDAGAFTGPILPYELATKAQILFEARGGFGRDFKRKRHGPESLSLRNYPCNSGIFGSGCNMAFRRDALLRLGGFDEALDTGAPLPGGGDLDIFYRVIRAGLPIAYEPRLVIFHQHRREYRALRHQMYTWGLGMLAYAVKNYRADPSQRKLFRCMILGWFRAIVALAIKSMRRGCQWELDLALAELWGGVVGLFGEYDRSRLRIEDIRRRFPA